MSMRTILISKSDLERLKSLLASARKFLRNCGPEHLTDFKRLRTEHGRLVRTSDPLKMHIRVELGGDSLSE